MHYIFEFPTCEFLVLSENNFDIAEQSGKPKFERWPQLRLQREVECSRVSELGALYVRSINHPCCEKRLTI